MMTTVTSEWFMVWVVITSAFGTGYFIYGWKQQKIVPLIAGIVLGIFPFVISNAWCSIAIGLVFLILPFVVRI